MLALKVLEIYDLSDAYISGNFFRVCLNIQGAEYRSVRVAYEDYLILIESLAEIIDQTVEVFFLHLDGRKTGVAFFELTVVGSAASGLVPIDYGKVVNQIVEVAEIHITRGRSGTAVKGHDDRIILILAVDENIAFAVLELDVTAFVDAVLEFDGTLDFIDVAAGRMITIAFKNPRRILIGSFFLGFLPHASFLCFTWMPMWPMPRMMAPRIMIMLPP